MELNNLKPAKGSTHHDKRIGRGAGSGHGGTATRGHKGAQSRSGYSRKLGFEGGQMPSYRQMPKLKGFTNFNAINYAEINVKDLERLGLESVDLDALIGAGKVHPSSEGLRVLGNGEISKAVSVKANYFTPSAKEKIEKAGGKAELV